MAQTNPYAAPSAPVADLATASDDGQLIEGGHAVPAGNGWQWIVDGFNLFKRNPGVWILNLIILFAITLVLAFIPIIGGLILNLTYPVFFGGLMLGCRALMHDEPLEVGHLFAGFRDKVGPLIMVAVFYLIGAVVIAIVVGVGFGFSMLGMMFRGGAGSGMVSVAAILLDGAGDDGAVHPAADGGVVRTRPGGPARSATAGRDEAELRRLSQEHRAVPGLWHHRFRDRHHRLLFRSVSVG